MGQRALSTVAIGNERIFAAWLSLSDGRASFTTYLLKVRHPGRMTATHISNAKPLIGRIAALEARLWPVCSEGLPAETREALRSIVLLGSFFFLLGGAAYLATISWSHALPRDGTTLVVGRDFLNFWMYGRAAFDSDPGRFYDIQTYNQALAGLLGPNYPGQHWSYPPSNLLLAAPFGLLGYLPALALWTMLGLAIFIAVASRQISDWRLLVPILLSPAAFLALVSGQSSFITTA